MIDSEALRLPRIRLRDPRGMRYGGEPLAAVAKAGNRRLRLQQINGTWDVVQYVRGGPVPYRADWIAQLGSVSRETAVAAFMAIIGQLKLFDATVVIASTSTIKP